MSRQHGRSLQPTDVFVARTSCVCVSMYSCGLSSPCSDRCSFGSLGRVRNGLYRALFRSIGFCRLVPLGAKPARLNLSLLDAAQKLQQGSDPACACTACTRPKRGREQPVGTGARCLFRGLIGPIHARCGGRIRGKAGLRAAQNRPVNATLQRVRMPADGMETADNRRTAGPFWRYMVPSTGLKRHIGRRKSAVQLTVIGH